MTTQKEWEKEVRDVFKKVSSRKEKYFIDVNGVEICVFPNVFSPAYFTDSKWFAEVVPQIVGRSSFLEIGTGTGIVALFAGLNGAEVIMTDINPDAVENAKYNFKKHGVKLEAYCGDIYEPLPKNKRFDFIFWNHPFNRGDDPNEEVLLKSGFDFKYEGLEKYISGADAYLNPGGRILLGTGNFALLPEIEKLAGKYNYKMELIKKIEMPLAADSSIDNDYRVYEFVR